MCFLNGYDIIKKATKNEIHLFSWWHHYKGFYDLYQQAGDSLQRWIKCIIILIPTSVECSNSYHAHRVVTEKTKCSQS